MILTKIYFLLLCLSKTVSLYLSTSNQDLLFRMIRNPRTPFRERVQTNILLFHCYKNWAINQAFSFKIKHKHKCKHIDINELISYSTFGLYKSILKFNGQNNFTRFSVFYVQGELYKGLTNAYSISSVSKYERMKSYNKRKRETTVPIMIASFDEEWKFNFKNTNKIETIEQRFNREKIQEAWEIINQHDAFTSRIFYLKYDNDFNIIRTNKNISSLMCCTEEYVRKKIAICKTNMLPYLALSQKNIEKKRPPIFFSEKS